MSDWMCDLMDPSTPHFEPCDTAPAIVVFTRDLRVHDNPALIAAGAGGRPTVSLFVLDDRLLGGPRPPIRRLRFLGEALRDLDHSLRSRGGGLVIRRGNWASRGDRHMAAAVGAREVHIADDHSAFAVDRFQQLESMAINTKLEVYRHPGAAVVPPAVRRTNRRWRVQGLHSVLSPMECSGLASDRASTKAADRS